MGHKSDEKLWNICMDIYRQLYREATPSADFDAMLKSGEAHKPQFFMKYYLPDARVTQVIDAHCRRNRLDKRGAHRVSKEIVLGSCPTSARKDADGETADKEARSPKSGTAATLTGKALGGPTTSPVVLEGDASIRNFWKKWAQLYQAGDETAMEEHVSSMMACKQPGKSGISSSMMAGVINTYFMDLAEYLQSDGTKDLSTVASQKAVGEKHEKTRAKPRAKTRNNVKGKKALPR